MTVIGVSLLESTSRLFKKFDARSLRRVMASSFVDGLSFQFPATMALLGFVLVFVVMGLLFLSLLELTAHNDSPILSKLSVEEASLGASALCALFYRHEIEE